MTLSIRNPKPVRFQLIAGRGSLGDINWGAAGRDIKVLKHELAELKKHIGERVLVTGGGGPGGSLATLRGAKIVKEGYIRGKPGLSVVLTNIDPKYGGYKPYGKEAFSPWIDSWQIAIPVKNPLMPEKIRGQLNWTNIGSTLVLSRGGIVVAQWDPYIRSDLPRGIVSIYGEPEGKSFFYKTWPAWKRKIWEAYRMTPPESYVLNPRGRRRARFIHMPSGKFLPHIETSKLVSRKRAIRYQLPVVAASNPVSLRNQQSVFSITPISQEAKDWVEDNISLESWQWMGPSFVVEHRYVADVVAGMMEAGLQQYKDFRVG